MVGAADVPVGWGGGGRTDGVVVGPVEVASGALVVGAVSAATGSWLGVAAG